MQDISSSNIIVQQKEWILSTPQLLFEVLTKERTYRIYTDGQIEGFEDALGIFNCFPLLYSEGLRQGLTHALECPECRKVGSSSEEIQD